MVEGRGVGVVLYCYEQVGDDSEDLQLFARVNGRFWFGTWNGLRYYGGLGRDWRDFVFLAKCMNHKGNM